MVKSSVTEIPRPRGRPKIKRHPADDGKPHKTWSGTDWDVTEKNVEWYKSLTINRSIGSLEEATTTEGEHLQWQITFPYAHRFSFMKKLAPKAHLEPTVCHKEDNYQRKQDSVLLWDIDNTKQGRRPVFQEQKLAIAAGATMSDTLDFQGANYQSVRSAELLMKYTEPPRAVSHDLVVIDNLSMPEIYTLSPRLFKPMSLSNWEGYDADPDVLVDCLYHKVSLEQYLELTGPYPFRVPCKFGSRQARYKRIFIFNKPLEW